MTQQPQPGQGPVKKQPPKQPAKQLEKELQAGQDTNERGAPDKAKSGVGVFELPGGYIDSEGVLHTEVQLREMTGVEEDLMGSRSGNVLKRLNQVMANCIERLGSITDKRQIAEAIPGFTVVDRNFMFVALRRVSLGDDYKMRIECPKCDKPTPRDMVLDLNSLAVTKMPDPMKREYEVELPSGNMAVWRVMTGEEEEKLSTLREAAQSKDVLTYSLMMRLISVSGKELSLGQRLKDSKGRVNLDKEGKEAFRLVKGMPIRDRDFLRSQFREKEAGMDTDVEFECPDCDEIFVSTFDPAQMGFFFPSGL